MCWKSNIEPIPIIAKDNIIVYKYGFRTSDDYFESRFRCHPYKKQESQPIVKINIYTYDLYAKYSVYQGYHSYLTLDILKYHLKFERMGERRCFNNLAIAAFIIPKDTIYYLNDNKEIVSESIIFLDFLENNK